MNSGSRNSTKEETQTKISTTGLVKRYKHVIALEGVSLQVYPGDLFGLLGPNGAGKTTMIRILAGLILPTAGDAYLDGINLNRNTSKALMRTGFVMDTPAFYPHLTGRQNLMALTLMQANSLKFTVDEVLSYVGMSESADRPVKTYSLGMKRRLDIGRALLNDPEILILDEPTSGLDPMGAEQVRRLLVEFISRGKTVLFSSHLLHDVEQLCNRVAIIAKGKLVVQDELPNLLSSRTNTARLRFASPQDAVQLFNSMSENPLLDQTGNVLLVDLSKRSLGELLTLLEQHDLSPAEISRSGDLQQLFLKLTGEQNE